MNVPVLVKEVIDKHYPEVLEQVQAHLRRGETEQDGKNLLIQHRDALLGQFDQVLPLVPDNPSYAVLAFIGRINYRSEVLNRFVSPDGDNDVAVCLDDLRETKAIQIGPEIQEAWQMLERENPEALVSVVILGYHLQTQIGGVI